MALLLDFDFFTKRQEGDALRVSDARVVALEISNKIKETWAVGSERGVDRIIYYFNLKF